MEQLTQADLDQADRYIESLTDEDLERAKENQRIANLCFESLSPEDQNADCQIIHYLKSYSTT